jgi:hypothetical protein
MTVTREPGRSKGSGHIPLFFLLEGAVGAEGRFCVSTPLSYIATYVCVEQNSAK